MQPLETTRVEEDVFVKVHGNPDLWIHVLDFLPYSYPWAASATSHFHLTCVRLMRRAFTRLAIKLHDESD